MKNYQSAGLAGKAQAFFAQKVREAEKAFGKQIQSVIGSKRAFDQFGNSLVHANKMTRRETMDIARLVRKVEESGGSFSDQERAVINSRIAANKYQLVIDTLTEKLEDIPPTARSKVIVETSQSMGALEWIQHALDEIEGTHHSTVITHRRGGGNGYWTHRNYEGLSTGGQHVMSPAAAQRSDRSNVTVQIIPNKANLDAKDVSDELEWMYRTRGWG
jgi:hypothetical protein